MSKFFFFSISVLIFAVFVSCSVLKSEREKGIKYAQEGDWDRAISYLERYVYGSIEKFPAAISLYEDPSLRKGLDVEEYKSFAESVFYLLSSYFGKSGFDWVEIGQKVLDIKDVDTSTKEGRKKVAEKILEIFGGDDDIKLRERIFYIYKSIRLAEKFLYGKENVSNQKDLFPEISNFLQKDERDFYEAVRFVNSIEYIYGKTLIWGTVAESVFLKQIQYSLKKNAGETPSVLPSYCCLFGEGETGTSKYPYIIDSKSIPEMLKDLFVGMANIVYGTMVSSAEFSDFATRYADVEDEILEDLQEKVNKSCEKWSKRFFASITAALVNSELLTDLLENFSDFSTYSIEAELNDDRNILCPPQEIFASFFYDVMCSYSGEVDNIYDNYSTYIARAVLPGYSQKITFQVLFEIPRPGDIPAYKDCQKQDKDQSISRKAVTILLRFKPDPAIDVPKVIDDVCLSDSFKKLSDFDSFVLFLSVNIEDKGRKLLEEIFRSRFEPQVCSINGGV